MWHLHGHEQLWWSDEEVMKLHAESCPHKDCNPEESPDPGQHAVDCLNELSSEHDAPQFVCADDCDVCQEAGSCYDDEMRDFPIAQPDPGRDEEMALESNLYPWLDDPNCD